MYETALVTGASSGIGRAIAKALAKQGTRLALSARRREVLEALADELEATGAPRPVVLPADLSRRGEAARLGAAAEAALGKVELLVNNAGVALGGAQAVVADDDMARELFETNYWSPLALVRALAPGMRARRSGAIVNISSIGSVVVMPLGGHYSSSKAALALATEAMRLELSGTGVHVFHVLPGPVETPMLAEVGALPSAERVFRRMPVGDVDTLANKIVRGLARKQQTLVYPGMLGIVRHLPTLALAAGRRMTGAVEGADSLALRGGSSGDAQHLRAAVEAREAAPGRAATAN